MSAAHLLTASRLVLTLPIIVLMYVDRPWAAWTALVVTLAAAVFACVFVYWNRALWRAGDAR